MGAMPAAKRPAPVPPPEHDDAQPVPPPRRATPPRLTLGDVAQALGVSRATVSNAFNRPDQLSAARREEILAKARELGYFGPDPAARALRRRAVLREIAVVYHHGLQHALSDPLGLEFLRGVAEELDRRALSLQLIPKLGRDLELAAAFQTTADALIVHAEIGAELVPEVIAARKPLVLVDTRIPDHPDIPCIVIDDREGARLAMAHALARQPDRVMALCFTLNDAQRAYAHGRRVRRPGASIAVERRIGYVQAARSAGWPPERIDWIEIDDLDPDQAGAALAARRATLAAGCRVAVVAMTDRMALAGRQEAARWPDVTLAAIVGFDDIPAAAPAGLTTVRQDAHRKGRLAVQVLLDAPAAPMPPLPVALVVRDT